VRQGSDLGVGVDRPPVAGAVGGDDAALVVAQRDSARRDDPVLPGGGLDVGNRHVLVRQHRHRRPAREADLLGAVGEVKRSRLVRAVHRPPHELVVGDDRDHLVLLEDGDVRPAGDAGGRLGGPADRACLDVAHLDLPVAGQHRDRAGTDPRGRVIGRQWPGGPPGAGGPAIRGKDRELGRLRGRRRVAGDDRRVTGLPPYGQHRHDHHSNYDRHGGGHSGGQLPRRPARRSGPPRRAEIPVLTHSRDDHRPFPAVRPDRLDPHRPQILIACQLRDRLDGHLARLFTGGHDDWPATHEGAAVAGEFHPPPRERRHFGRIQIHSLPLADRRS